MLDLKKIIKCIQSEITRKDILIIIGIVVLFFLTRLVNLKNFPVFTDEGIYIRWAKVALQDPSWRFISLTDGRQPLQTWGTIPFLKMFPTDALLAGRLFAVSTGFMSLLGVFAILWYLFKKHAALLGSFLYVVMPYFVFYDRMALADSAVNAGFIWMLFLSILLAKTRRLDVALLFGFATGFSLLTKSSSRMFLMLAAFGPLFFINKKYLSSIWKTLNYYVLLGIGGSIGLLFYNIQRLSPYMHFVEKKNTTFVMTFQEFLDTPFKFFIHNVKLIPTFASWEAGFIIVMFSVWGFWKLWNNDRRLFFYLLAFTILPFIALSFFAKIVFPRYLIFFASILLITGTYGLLQIKSIKVRLLFVGILIFSMLIFDYPLVFDAKYAFFPKVDRDQYVEGVDAVWGVDEFMREMDVQSKTQTIFLLAEGDFGLIADVLKVFDQQGNNIEIQGIWPLDEKDILEYQKIFDRKVYIVFSHRQEFPTNWPIKLYKVYDKPMSNIKLYVFEYKELLTPSVIIKEKAL